MTEPAKRRTVPLLSLSPEYLKGVSLAGVLTQPGLAPASAPAAPTAAAPASTVPGEQEFHCRVSGVSFDSADALREHYHSDWYRYNLQRSTRSMPPVSEDEFDSLIEANALDAELSGSGSDDDDDEECAGEVAALSDGRVALSDSAGGTLLVWRASLVPSLALVAELPAALQLLSAQRPPPVWVIVLCRGGHFAAAAFELQVLTRPPKKPEDAVRVLGHRCFHRYVTRRKAGGRQSVADGAKTIKSAGSSIRRHNEAMLAKESRELLTSWLPTHLRQSALVWTAAPGPANAAVLFAGADAPLAKADPRLRSVPFNTARPTLAEATRVAVRLGMAEYPTEEELAAIMPAGPADGGGVDAAMAAEATAVATAAADAAAEAAAARRAATAEATAALEAQAAAMPCELHEAAAADDAELVSSLLASGHDPTVTHIRFGFGVAYDVAKSKVRSQYAVGGK